MTSASELSARALNTLGAALRQVRRFEEAITAHQDAAQTYRDTGDDYSEAIARDNLQKTLRARDATQAEQPD